MTNAVVKPVKTITTTTRTPPIHCTPCRVTYEGVRYQIESNGTVRTSPFVNGSHVPGAPEPESVARLVRREASRLRRNRTARERHSTMKDLGYVKTPYGYE